MPTPPTPSSPTRRTLLRVSFAAGGALLVGCAAPAPAPAASPAPPTAAPPTAAATATPAAPATPEATPAPTAALAPDDGAPLRPNVFVRVDTDGTVTLTVHRSEMGQGVRTALAMVLAEELEADWASVRVEQAMASADYGSMVTSGSGSVTGFYSALRDAGAAARRVLVAAAAATWGVPEAECMAEMGAVAHAASGRRLGYGDLVRAARALPPPSGPAPRKDPKAFRLIGTSVPRVDGPDIVTGRATYGLDVRLPGMLFAAVARCPVPGGTLASLDDSRAKGVPGVRAVVPISTGVAVVAENTWAALRGRAALRATWDEGALASVSSAGVRRTLAGLLDEAAAADPSDSARTIEARYETPYLAHMAMEPPNCAADVRPGRCDVWAPTQNPQAVQDAVRRVAGAPTFVHVTLMGGGFGRRLEVDDAVEAAEVSKAVGAPAQVVWTRDDDIRHDFYRQATMHWMQAGLDSAGALARWRHVVAAQGINGIVYRGGLEVLEEGLEAPYAVPDGRSRALLADIPLRTGPWRAVVMATNAFANECFLDEVAAAMGRDPLELRLLLLPEGHRLRGVLELAASKAGWGAPLPEGFGRGIACHHVYGQTAVAMVAEVSAGGGRVRVHRVVCAINCGDIVNPDMVAQQMEGGVAFGLTSMLKGAVTFAGGRAQQSSFADCQLLQLAEMPEVEVHTLRDGRPPQGVGEMAVPAVVPAVANAIFAATGARIRRLPLRASDLRG